MSNLIDVSSISIGNHGQVVLSDPDLCALEQLYEQEFGPLAGGSNGSCPGSNHANFGCANGSCVGSKNSQCQNNDCQGSSNTYC